MWTLRAIVIGIVVAVALSQRGRQQSFQPSPLPGRPLSFPGARAVPQPGRIAVQQPSRPRIRTPVRSRARPVPRISIKENTVFTTPRPAPTPAPVVENEFRVFRDEDLDYFEEIGFNDQDYVLDNRNNQPEQQSFRPVEITPQFRPQPITPAPIPQTFRPIPAPKRAPRPVQRVNKVSDNSQRGNLQLNSSPRRGTINAFKHQFDLQGNEQTTPRGRQEPNVQIIKSWSNRNTDGTFSYGYINTDGSFKNETKGVDCVVRGVYGYIDAETGETRSYPYVSGNPCDPDAPDYYYDYEEGRLVGGGQTVQRPQANPSQQSSRRRP